MQIIFYAPQLFLSLGVGPCSHQAAKRMLCTQIWHVLVFRLSMCSSCPQGSRQDALIATVVVGLCNHFSTYASFWLVREGV